LKTSNGTLTGVVLNKNIEYYLGLPYTRELIPDTNGKWFIRIKELPNCFSQGDTPEEAFRMIEDALRGWLEVELEENENIPEPHEEEYSGKFNTRIPRSLHRKVVEAAENEGVSLNQWIVSILSEAVGATKEHKQSVSANEFSVFTQSVFKLLEFENLLPEEHGGLEQAFALWVSDQMRFMAININDLAGIHESLGGMKKMMESCVQQSPLMDSFYRLIEVFSQIIKRQQQPAISGPLRVTSEPSVYSVVGSKNKVIIEKEIADLISFQLSQKQDTKK
jgi:antitoxin HicB